MRILLPTIRDPGQVGGTTTHLDMLARGLAQNGHDPRVLYLGEELPSAVNRLGLHAAAGVLNRVRRGWGALYASALRGEVMGRLVEREQGRSPFDVINAQEVYSVPALRRVADVHGVPLVLTLHGYPLYESRSEGYVGASAMAVSWVGQRELAALRLADAVVTVDTRLLDHVRRFVPEIGERAVALMNFVDTSAFQPSYEGRDELRRSWGVDGEKVVLFCPRRLVKKNGVTTPARALATMPPEVRSRFVLLHAGEGGERQAIEDIVRQRGLGDVVRLLGNRGRDQIAELYRLADIVLVPSVHSENVEEATSLAALEAMASGRPLIAGAVGGLAEMVEDGSNGLLFPGGDAEALSKAILRLADDPALGHRLAETARDYVVREHSHLRAAADYVEVYEAAATRRDATVASPQTSFPTLPVLGFPVHETDLEGAVAWGRTALEAASARPSDGAYTAISVNPELVVRARRDPRAADALLDGDLRYPDGVGVVWASRQRGARGVGRVPGIELAGALVAEAAARGVSVFLLGAEDGVAAEAAAALQARVPGLLVAGTHHGYFTDDEEPAVVQKIRDSGAGLLLVATGAPRQEVFLRRRRDELGPVVALGVGGSLDVWAGRVARAPGQLRRVGLEWLYRLATDPRRMRRQLVSLPWFAWSALFGAPDEYASPRRARR